MELKFGTAGIRGIMGPEPGQMNLETVRLATRGAAGFSFFRLIFLHGPEGWFDSPHRSKINFES